MIAQNILDGRKIIEEYRIKHSELYKKGLSNKEIIEGHRPLIDEMREKLKLLGFKNESELMAASKMADEKEKVVYWS